MANQINGESRVKELLIDLFPSGFPQRVHAGKLDILNATLNLMLNSKFPMCLFWGDDELFFYNDAYIPILGAGERHPQALSRPGCEVWPEVWPLIDGLIRSVKETGLPTWDEDQLVPIIRAGQLQDAYWTYSYSAIYSSTGDRCGVFVTCTETTERKNAELKLLKLNDQLQLSQQISHVGYWEIDMVNGTAYWSKEMFTLLSCAELSEPLPISVFLENVDVNYRESLLNAHQLLVEKNIPLQNQFLYHKPDGSQAYFITKANVVTNDQGIPVRIEGITQDITEQRTVEEYIENMRKEKEATLNRITDAIISFDKNWHYTYLNDAAMVLNPLSREETLGKHILEVHPELEFTETWSLYQKAMDDNKVSDIKTYYEPYSLWIHAMVYPSATGATFYYRDVTEQTLAAEKIILNEKKLLRAYEIGQFGYWHWDIAKDYINVSQQAMNIFKSVEKEGEITLKDLTELIIGDFSFQAALKNGMFQDGKYNLELQLSSTDSSRVKFVAIVAEKYKDLISQQEMVVGTVQDISSRKKAENTLADYQYALDESSIVAITNEKGVILAVNENFCNISQYSSDELIGSDHRLINSGYHPRSFFVNMWRTISSGKIWRGEIKNKAKDGSYYWVDTTVVPFLNATGYPYQYMAIRTDITDRIKTKQELQTTNEELRKLSSHLHKVREEERMHIAREIHDELGQQLTGLKMQAGWLAKSLGNDEKRVAKLRDMSQLITESISCVKRIASNLRPAILDDLGLIAAIEWLSEETQMRSTLNIQLNLDKSDEQLPFEVVTGVFRIYQEALTNILRHSNARNVAVNLLIDSSILKLSVNDDGIGISEHETRKNTFGLTGIKERAFLLNGSVSITGKQGIGTQIKLSIPLYHK